MVKRKKKTAKKTKKKTAKRAKGARKKTKKKTAKRAKTAKRVVKKAKTAGKKTAKRAKTAKTKTKKAASLAVGKTAPAFSLPTDGGALDLASFKGKKNVVLYFYPKDDTPGCTVQACTFEKDTTDYSSHDTVVVGVSADSAESHAKFRNKYNLSFPLVVDSGAKLAKKYGVWVEKNNYGKKYMGIQRTTFLIDKEGKVAMMWPKVQVEGHSAVVLDAIRTL